MTKDFYCSNKVCEQLAQELVTEQAEPQPQGSSTRQDCMSKTSEGLLLKKG